MAAMDNGYRVGMEESASGWTVHIVAPDGHGVFQRACADEVEARTFASTVRQHIGWLSPEKFRQYYRLPEPA
ncbi:MAG TPA: hypothetical protein VGB28_04320 [Actinomycetota bacterium]|jgi:hypothetical protein